MYSHLLQKLPDVWKSLPPLSERAPQNLRKSDSNTIDDGAHQLGASKCYYQVLLPTSTNRTSIILPRSCKPKVHSLFSRRKTS